MLRDMYSRGGTVQTSRTTPSLTPRPFVFMSQVLNPGLRYLVSPGRAAGPDQWSSLEDCFSVLFQKILPMFISHPVFFCHSFNMFQCWLLSWWHKCCCYWCIFSLSSRSERAGPSYFGAFYHPHVHWRFPRIRFGQHHSRYTQHKRH